MNPVETFLTDQVDRGIVPGAVCLVARGDDARTLAVGRMSADGPPMRDDAIMRIQSMTKPVVTVAALRACESGDLALDDPIARWLPEFADPQVLRAPDAPIGDVVAVDRPITVRDLLVNGAGVGMQLGETPLAQAMRAAGVEAGPDPVALPADDWLAALAALPLAHQPGRGWRYHHGFGVLGILLQRMGEEQLEAYLRRTVLDPLGMQDTGLSVPQAELDRLPAAYRHEDGRLVETEPLGGGFYAGEPPFDTAHGELVSTAADYHRFCRMLVDRGRCDGRSFLGPHLVDEMRRDQVPDEVKTPDSFFPGFWEGMGWGYGGSVVIRGERAGTYGWAGGQGTDFSITSDGTIAVLLTQVELGEVTWPLVRGFADSAAALLET